MTRAMLLSNVVAAAEIANMDPEFLLRLFKMALGPEFKQVEKLFGKDVPAGIRRMLTNGEFSGLPPEVIQILSQLAGLPPPPPPSRARRWRRAPRREC